MIWVMIFISVVLICCREKYFADYEMPASGFLVVNGFINGGGEPTEIRLSRSNKLTETPAEVMETGATVLIESDADDRYPLIETSPGVYSYGALDVNPSRKYRLFIKARGKEYISEFSGKLSTPDIDSVSWKQNNNGVQFYIHSHDESNNTRYYQWKFEETWEINSPFLSALEYNYDSNNKLIGVKYKFDNRMADTTMQRCWAKNSSQVLIVGSTEKLSNDVIYLPLYFVGAESEKMSVAYSILTKQYALSQRAYNFILTMKKNTEQLGSVFDPQPSQLTGNIKCITNPSEVVIGFVEVVEQKTKRIFINRRQLNNWNYTNTCQTTVIDNKPDSIAKYAGGGLVPSVVYSEDMITGEIIAFNAAPGPCVDCKLRGATNVKPEFWPQQF